METTEDPFWPYAMKYKRPHWIIRGLHYLKWLLIEGDEKAEDMP